MRDPLFQSVTYILQDDPSRARLLFPMSTATTTRPPCQRLYLLVGLCLLGLALGATANADVYKWTDPKGRIHYTDRPPPPEGRLLSVGQSNHAAPPTDADAPRAVPSPATAAPAAPTALPPADASAQARLKAGVAADVSAHDAEACTAAQARYRNYIGARHLFRAGAHDERVYLSDAEIETARIQARQEVEELCGHAP